jgi:Ulp1 family protease
LCPGQWLDDVIVNYYSLLLYESLPKHRKAKVARVPSNFYTKALGTGVAEAAATLVGKVRCYSRNGMA